MSTPGRYGQHKTSKIAFTIHLQRKHHDWLKTVAPPGGISDFVDHLVARAKEREENGKLWKLLRSQRVKIARLENQIVKLGGSILEDPS